MKLTTLAEAHAGPDASYHGDYPTWMIVASTYRDDNILGQANWQAWQQLLLAEDGDQLQHHIERSGHWAVGWVEYLVICPDADLLLEVAEAAHNRLAEYPVLDDELLSDMEHEATQELWDMYRLGERIQYLQENKESIFAARAKNVSDLYARAEQTFYDTQHSATE